MYHYLNHISQKLLPDWLYERLIGQWDKGGFIKYFKNTGWIFIARIVSFVISFFTIAIVARYLGPENYGKLSYAQSFVAIFSIFASLGIDQILYRDLISHPDKEKQILGTSFLAKAICGSVTLITTCIAALIINDDIVLTWLIAIISLTFLLQPFGVLSLYFNARVAAKYTSIATIILAFLIPALKICVIFFDKGILYFAGIIVFEALFIVIYNIYIYLKLFKGSLFDWNYSSNALKKILLDSWPLLLTGFAGYLYGRVDQVMIQHAIDSTAVGIYDVAVRLSEISGFIPGILIASLFPAIINAKKHSHQMYIKRFINLTLISLAIAGCFALIISLFSTFIVKIIFGPAFSESASILQIYIWTLIGAISVTLIQSYLITENRTKKILLLSILGAITNIVLNWYLIPRYGIYGAAYTSLISYLFIITTFFITEPNVLSKLTKLRA